MTKSKPLVSVIIPVYNGEKYLAEAIKSVLAQTYRPIEVIVVDDGSTDGSADVAKGFVPFVQCCFQPNGGTGAARNRGIDLARGSFFAFLDADDVWVKDKLTLQMAAFDANPDVDIVFGHVKQFHSPELDESAKNRIRCPAELMPGHLPSAMLIKRNAFFRVGLFETHWQVGQDVSWVLRAMEQRLNVIMLPDLVYMRRLHKNNKGITKRQFITQRVQILKASLDRRRKMGLLDGDNSSSES
jgi:glycosyltransferase involved in cell wall biosynthesis